MNALITFLKNPERGKAKTRLAAGIGPDAALEAYIELLSHTRNVALAVDAKRFLFYKDEIWKDEWKEDAFEKHLQPSGNLGEKMKAAFQFVFDQSAAKVAIIGSDCGELQPELITEAFNKLETHDVVIGPAEDGGYYLLAMKQAEDFLFENKSWSTEELLKETIADLKKQGKTFFLLKELYDIDTIQEWKRWKNLA